MQPKRSRRRAARWAAGLALLVCVGHAALAADEPAPTTETVAAERAAVAAELAALDAAAPDATERRGLLERLDRYLVQQLDALERAGENGSETANDEPRAPADAGPVDLAAYDAAVAAADRTELLVRRLDRARRDAAAALEAATKALDEAEQRRRSAKEAAEARPGDAAAARTLVLRELESRVARAAVRLRSLELANAKAALEANRVRAARNRDRLAALRERLVLRPADRERDRAAIDEEQTAERARLRAARRALDEASARLRAAEAGSSVDREALRGERAALQREVALLAERLDRLDRARAWVDQRVAVLMGGAPRPELEAWRAALREDLASLEREESLKLAEAAEVERERAAVRDTAAGTTPARARYLAALDRLAALYQEDLAHLGTTRERGRRLADDLAARTASWSLRERAAQALAAAGAVWRYEITSSDDRPITVGKVVLALVVFAAGWAVARLLARVLGRRALPRLGFDAGAAHAFESLGFYALLAVAFVIALRMVNIPLTAFAVAGGAIAIGVGFGSQNVVSNFISGLILLAERPIKIGDLVELEGTYGNVERIGLRSTSVRTGENVHVIVPNAMFLETRVINWTHTDRTVRVRLPVGVAYGSPTRTVERILLEAMREHPRVLATPAPKVLFTDFGDSALVFECHFWLELRVLMDRREVESQLRYRIDERFREAGVTIAFPQRDVHLDTAAPLAVRVVSDAGPREPR